MLDIVIILVMPNAESHCGQGNGFACEPAYTLEAQDLICIIAQSLVLYVFVEIRTTVTSREETSSANHDPCPTQVSSCD